MGYNSLRSPRVDLIKLIRESIDEEQIWIRYIPNFKSVNKLFSSPFRSDRNPSCIVNLLKGKLVYRDFGNNEVKGDIFNILQSYWNCSFREVCDRIISDFNINRNNSSSLNSVGQAINQVINQNKYLNNQEEKVITTIDIEIRKWEQKDKIYWLDQYGIDFKELKNNQIFPLGYFKIIKTSSNNSTAGFQFNDGLNTLIYGLKFIGESGEVYWKIYQPKNEEYRFISNIPWSCFEFDILDKEVREEDKSLIITKSRKDKIIIDKVIDKSKVDILVVQSERENNLSGILEKVKRYKQVVIIFDNDETGLDFSTQLRKKVGSNCTNISSLLEYKDSAEYSKNKQLIRLKNLIERYIE